MTTIDPRFATEDSGGIGRYRATVVDAYFAEGKFGTELNVKNKLAAPELFPNIEDGEWTERFSCGKDWTSADGGKTITHPAGDAKKYNSASQIGILTNGNKGKATFEDEPYLGVSGFGTSLPADFSMYRAASFIGLDAEWDTVTWATRRPKREPVIAADGTPVLDVESGQPMLSDVVGADGRTVFEDAETSRRMPVVFHGIGGTLFEQPATSAASSNGHGDFSFVATMDPTLRGAVKAAAATSDTSDQFAAQVVNIPNALTNSELVQAMANKDQFAGLKAALAAS